jgi:CheY-like chemotaxis protein
MRRVLVVDDTEDVRFLYQAVLSRCGFEVDQAASGPEALQFLDFHDHPAAVLLDVQMPDMDGWETLQAIRAHPNAGEIPVILCTVKASEHDTRKAWELGSDGFLTKPFSIEALTGELAMVTARTSVERRAIRSARADHE